MRTRFLIVISVVVLATGACGASRNGSDRSRTIRPETLLLATGEGPLSLRAPSGAVVFERAGGVPSPDGSLVFSTSQVGGATRLDAADARTGGIFESSRVPGHLAVRAVSESGDEVALMAPLPLGWDPWTPRPRSGTTIVVADPSGTLEPKTFHLSGNFEPEAFSTDDGRLFMIQYLPPEAPSVYRVTVLDLAHGSVDPVFGPYKGPTERMPGTRLEQVRAPDGSQLYTLYTSERPGYAPHGAPVARNAVVSFVHVLSLTDGWAHCVGLPKPFWHRPASAEALATSPDGSKLYVVDTGIGMATVLDTSSLEILDTASIGARLPDTGRTTAVVSSDGSALLVGAGSSLLAIDTSTLRVDRRIEVSGGVSGLGLSGDGTQLYVAEGDGLEVLDPPTWSRLGVVPLTSPAPILQVSALGS